MVQAKSAWTPTWRRRLLRQQKEISYRGLADRADRLAGTAFMREMKTGAKPAGEGPRVSFAGPFPCATHWSR